MTERAVGVMLPRDLPAHLFRTYAQRAETLGFDELWVVEDCFFRGGVAQAAAALAMTERIRVGIGILPAAVRNAAFTAMEVATLAELFPGRVDIGIGHGMPGWMRQVGAWPASPLTMLGEHLDAVRAVLHGAPGERRRPVRDARRRRAEHPAQQRRRGSSPVSADRGRSRSRAGPPTARSSRSRSPRSTSPRRSGTSRRRASTGSSRTASRWSTTTRDAARDAARARAGVDRRPGLGRAHRPAAVRRRVPCAARRGGRAARRSPRAMPDAWVDQLAVVGTVDDARGAASASCTTRASRRRSSCRSGPDPLAALEDLARVL